MNAGAWPRWVAAAIALAASVVIGVVGRGNVRRRARTRTRSRPAANLFMLVLAIGLLAGLRRLCGGRVAPDPPARLDRRPVHDPHDRADGARDPDQHRPRPDRRERAEAADLPRFDRDDPGRRPRRPDRGRGDRAPLESRLDLPACRHALRVAVRLAVRDRRGRSSGSSPGSPDEPGCSVPAQRRRRRGSRSPRASQSRSSAPSPCGGSCRSTAVRRRGDGGYASSSSTLTPSADPTFRLLGLGVARAPAGPDRGRRRARRTVRDLGVAARPARRRAVRRGLGVRRRADRGPRLRRRHGLGHGLPRRACIQQAGADLARPSSSSRSSPTRSTRRSRSSSSSRSSLPHHAGWWRAFRRATDQSGRSSPDDRAGGDALARGRDAARTPAARRPRPPGTDSTRSQARSSRSSSPSPPSRSAATRRRSSCSRSWWCPQRLSQASSGRVTRLAVAVSLPIVVAVGARVGPDAAGRDRAVRARPVAGDARGRRLRGPGHRPRLFVMAAALLAVRAHDRIRGRSWPTSSGVACRRELTFAIAAALDAVPGDDRSGRRPSRPRSGRAGSTPRAVPALASVACRPLVGPVLLSCARRGRGARARARGARVRPARAARAAVDAGGGHVGAGCTLAAARRPGGGAARRAVFGPAAVDP